MKTQPDPGYGSIASDAEAIIHDIGALGPGGGFPSGLDDIVGDGARAEDMDWIERPSTPPMDGFAEVTVDADRLLARASFFPSSRGRSPVCLDGVKQRLEQLGVRHGVDWPAIESAMKRCNAELVPLRDVVVARATMPVKERPPYLVIDPGLLAEATRDGPAERKIDYRAISPFILVKKGDALARIEPRIPGELGYDLAGEAIFFRKERVSYPKPGKNTIGADGAVTAACDGRLILNDASIWINEVLEIPGNVDFSTGNVDFPGDIVIGGEVKTGFSIHAGGSVHCSGVIDATEVIADGDIVTERGILGRRAGRVKAGGRIQARFIENCFVEAAGSISVAAGCLNSIVHTLGRFDSGAKGVVSGGKIYASGGINVAQVGTASGAKTEIICGIDYTVEQKLVWIRDKTLALARKLVELNRLKGGESDAARETGELSARLKASISRLNEIAQLLVGKLDKNDRATVVVRGALYPETYIEICHVPFVVTSAMTRQRLSLDKESGRIVSEKLPR